MGQGVQGERGQKGQKGEKGKKGDSVDVTVLAKTLGSDRTVLSFLNSYILSNNAKFKGPAGKRGLTSFSAMTADQKEEVVRSLLDSYKNDLANSMSSSESFKSAIVNAIKNDTSIKGIPGNVGIVTDEKSVLWCADGSYCSNSKPIGVENRNVIQFGSNVAVGNIEGNRHTDAGKIGYNFANPTDAIPQLTIIGAGNSNRLVKIFDGVEADAVKANKSLTTNDVHIGKVRMFDSGHGLYIYYDDKERFFFSNDGKTLLMTDQNRKQWQLLNNGDSFSIRNWNTGDEPYKTQGKYAKMNRPMVEEGPFMKGSGNEYWTFNRGNNGQVSFHAYSSNDNGGWIRGTDNVFNWLNW